MEEAEATVAREKAEFDARRRDVEENTQETGESQDDRERQPQPTAEEDESANTADRPDNEPKDTSEEHKPEESKDDENRKTEEPQSKSETGVDAPHHGDIPETSNAGHDADIHRGAEDDGGEVVEDQEDTVIY